MTPHLAKRQFTKGTFTDLVRLVIVWGKGEMDCPRSPSRPVERHASVLSQVSRLMALSCHLRRKMWLTQLVSRKIAIPVTEIMMSAANMRGMRNW